jgi:hypothetical protein
MPVISGQTTPVSPIPTDPAATIAASDFPNYLLAVDHPDLGVDYREEVDRRLQRIKDKDGNPKYPTKPDRDAVLRTFDGYLDSELGGRGRLGNTLEDTNPQIDIHKDYTNGMPPTLDAVRTNRTRGPDVIVTPEGTVTHLKNGHEIPEAHEYMHEIFDYILYEARAKLEAINVKLQDYSETPNATTKAAYDYAVKAYDDFRASFPTLSCSTPANPSPFATAFNEVKFKPVVTNEGFTVGLRVQLNWKNPRHSSSTIKVP